MLPNSTSDQGEVLVTRTLAGEEQTVLFAQDIAMAARPGWTILLDGDLGVGKTSFARGFIRALAADPALEVPSPTFTLVQRYPEASPEIVHADLYRISDPSELIELGLDDPDDPAIRLIEWPRRAGLGTFSNALTVRFEMKGADARTVFVSGSSRQLAAIDHSFTARRLLQGAALGSARRTRFQGDASARRYELVHPDGDLFVFMDAPQQPDGPSVEVDLGPFGIRKGPYSKLVHLAENVGPFVALSAALNERGFSAPHIHAADLDAGLLLMQHLGGEGVLSEDGQPIAQRYVAAAEVLAELHSEAWPTDLPIRWTAKGPADAINTGDGATKNGDGSASWPSVTAEVRHHQLPRYDLDVYLTEIALCPNWYVPYRASLGEPPQGFDRASFFTQWQTCLEALIGEPETLVLRDFHSPNLIWRDAETGRQRIGIIDHQDALIGSPTYDLASLVQDARVTVTPDLQAQIIDAYLSRRRATKPVADETRFAQELALLSLQRNTKLMGLWARLDKRDGKPHYLKHMPRTLTYIGELFWGPGGAGLAPLRPAYSLLVPDLL